MIHHLGVFASDFEASRAFYRAALAQLGIVVGYEAEGVCELWHRDADTPSLSLHSRPEDPTRGLHLAFAAPDRAAVDAFFAAALEAGGTERNAPRHWPQYRAYCAFVSDPDGNNIEAVHKDP
ncbi:MAG: VOC family protein [Myxococcota bacterium]|nr:VOC family protein [Myxococcota bacterium]